MAFTNLPDEVLLQIITDTYSIREIRSLGLACRRFYSILLGCRYHNICRCLDMLSSESINPTDLTQQVTYITEATWARTIIAQSIADELYSDSWPFSTEGSKNPKKNPSIVEGCGNNWTKEIFANHLLDRGDRDVRRRLKRASKLIIRGDWDDRITEVAECAALRLTRDYQEEAGFYTLKTLHECHRLHGSSYKLARTRDSMCMALYHEDVHPTKSYYRARLRELDLTIHYRGAR